jgi:hypothetical protein
MQRRLTAGGGGGDRAYAAFKRRNALLKHGVGWIADA